MKKIINSITIGDILVYSPVDMDSKRHDIAIIYDIENITIYSSVKRKTKTKKYKIFWNRSRMTDVYSENTLMRKLQHTINSKKYLFLVKHK